MYQGRFEEGFRGDGFRAGFRDRWHSPKDGSAGVSAEASKKGRGLSGTRVTFREGSERSSGLACSKRGFRRRSRRGSSERVFWKASTADGSGRWIPKWAAEMDQVDRTEAR